MKDPRNANKVDAPPAGSKILRGFKATAASVPYSYHFGQWYKREVHVLPLDEAHIRANAEAYEQVHGAGILYECEYVGGHWDDPRTELFWITDYVRVRAEKVSVTVMWDGSVEFAKAGRRRTLYPSRGA